MSSRQELSWNCPLCGDRLPISYAVRGRLLVFTDSSFTDLHAHLWTHEPVTTGGAE